MREFSNKGSAFAAASLASSSGDSWGFDSQASVFAAPADRSPIDQRLATFIGFNGESYLEYYQFVYDEKSKGLFRHWHWVPFVFSISWIFLRRQYATGFALAIIPLAADVALPGGLGLAIAFLAIALLCGLIGRSWYMGRALRTIQKIEARRLWPVQRDERLLRMGNISIIGAISATVLWVAVVAAPYLLGWA